MTNISIGVKGRFKLVAVCAETGRERVVADWFDNLITNIGLNRMGTTEFGQYCFVGSGSTAPNVNDQVLSSFLAETSTIKPIEFGAASSAPYYGWERITYSFGQGAAAGNVSEVGIGWLDSSTNPTSRKVFSRTLVKDGSGNPTTVTVLPSEYLNVIHEIRMYAPTSDVTGQITISGAVYDYIIRAASATTGQLGYWRPNRGSAVIIGSYGGARAYSGDIGSVTSTPSGSNSAASITNESAYVDGSNERAVKLTVGLDDGNFSGGIRSFDFGGINTGFWQMQFSPTLPKTNEKVLNLSLKIAWARRP